MTPSSVVQLTVGGKAVLVPVSTIDSLATGIEPVTAPLRLASGHSRGLLEATCASEVPRNIGRQSSEESSQFHEELANISSAMTEVQEIFTQLLENFDSCTPHSRQHARAMNELWSFYESNSDELEAGAAELETVLCTRHSIALGQPMYRMSTLPSDMTVPQQMEVSENPNRQYQFSGKQKTQHRRSRSLS